MNRIAAGTKAEGIAEQYLRQQGLSTVARNFRCRLGELDLIMQDGDALIFVEVRLRRNKHFGGPMASINSTKQRKLIAAAQTYLQKHPQLQNRDQRFDVVGITGELNNNYSIEWLQNAIETNG